MTGDSVSGASNRNDRDVTEAAAELVQPTAISRRMLLGGSAAALVLAACGDDGRSRRDSSTSTSDSGETDATGVAPAATASVAALTAADFAALGTCRLTPDAIAGPFGLEEQFDRRDITEGAPGHPLRLGFRVVDRDCAPVAGAVVEVWHCDATGDYSAFTDGGGGKDKGRGTTFLRGSQSANADGIVEFQTIVPGWYPGRAVHLHLRAYVDDTMVLTSQVYFDDAFLSRVYRSSPYDDFGAPDTTLDQDGFAGNAAEEGTLLVTSPADTTAGRGTVGLLNLGIDKA